MGFDQRIVSQTPLHELWNTCGIVSDKELCKLRAADIARLLRMGKVQFVVADIGSPLNWVPVDKCYSFWKSEVKNHLADSVVNKSVEDFPDQYCYFASAWEAKGGEPIILLVMSH
jgi:hypothetical protein